MGEALRKIEIKDIIDEVSKVVSKITGNKLGESNFSMVETRIRKRMMDLGHSTPQEYWHYFDSHRNEEIDPLVSLLTTHHTFFFREFPHFQFIKDNLEQIVANAKKRGSTTLEVWSAASSRGHESYSLAMFLDTHLKEVAPGFTFKIYGSDIDPESVKFAQNAVYRKNEIAEIPMNYIGNHWAKGTKEISDYVKVKPSLTAHCEFEVVNLLDFKNQLGSRKFDFIFCRNVFIYFEKDTIQKITNSFINFLHPNGLIFTGISESLTGMNLPIKGVGPSIYLPNIWDQKPVAAVPSSTVAKKSVEIPQPVVFKKSSLPEKLRVLCVDDSKSIHTLLNKILAPTDGFEIVGHAYNGIEAHDFLSKNKVDLITLDIHMPEMTGLEYLQKYYKSGHAPVVILSSASRDDSDVAIKALSLGASDFVEKPSLNNLTDRGDEIRTKLRVAFMNKEKPSISSIDKKLSHQLTIKNPDHKIKVCLSGMSTLPKFVSVCNELQSPQPPVILFFEGHSEILEAVAKDLSSKIKRKIEPISAANTILKHDHVYLADFRKFYHDIKSMNEKRKTVILVFGQCSNFAEEQLLDWRGAYLVLEDLEGNVGQLKDVASDIVPTTSFAYLSTKYFVENE